jgi:indole-3-glycerol phosphate synthase
MSILDEIFAAKVVEVENQKSRISPRQLEKMAGESPEPPDFRAALTNASRPSPRLIAEIKHRSPSKGVLCEPFKPLELAEIYRENGAAAISVLTDSKYFGGSLEILEQVAGHLNSSQGAQPIPLLRKDFIFDRYQVLEARVNGASAVLLIAAMLDSGHLKSLIQAVKALGMAPLVEVHTLPELHTALDAGAEVIGINNRDLHTFSVDLQTTLDLVEQLPTGVVTVAESGISTRSDVTRLKQAGVDAMLIGEGIVKSTAPASRVRLFAQLEGAAG